MSFSPDVSDEAGPKRANLRPAVGEEQLSQAIADTLTSSLIVVDQDDVIRVINRSAATFLGFTPRQLVDAPLSRILPEAKCFDQTRTGGGRSWIETKGLHADGFEIPVRIACQLFNTADNHYCRMLLAPLALGDAEAASTTLALVNELIEGISDPIYIKDEKGRYVLANSALSTLTGLPSSHLLGRDDLQIYGPEMGQTIRDADRRIISSGISQTYEEIIGGADYQRQFLTTKVPYHDEDRNFRGLLGIARDITSYKWAEASSRSNERHLRRILDTVAIGVAVLSVEGIVRDINQAALATLQKYDWGRAQIQGKALSQTPLWPESMEQRQAFNGVIEEAAAGHRTIPIDIQIQSPGGVIDFEVMIAPMFDNAGEVSYLIASVVDITARRRAERRSSEQQIALAHLERLRSISHLASGLAHELNQPLGAISNYASAVSELLGQKKSSEGQIRETLTDISLEARRAGQIIARLRGFVKKQRPLTEEIAVPALLQAAVQLTQFRIRSADINLGIEVEDGLPQILADAVQMQQVLVNLISNALDAMAHAGTPEPRLKISARTGPVESVLFEVADSGPGVPIEKINSIFDLFYTTKPEGIGMGLALCKTIVEDHRGAISAHINDWGGLTVSFTLPSKLSL